MIEGDMKNHFNQVIITLNHFQENLQRGLDLRVMAQSELFMKGEVSVPIKLCDSDSAMKPPFYNFYFLTHNIWPGDVDSVIGAGIRFINPWIMRESFKCKVLFKHLITIVLMAHARRNMLLFKSISPFSRISLKLDLCLSMAISKILFQSLTFIKD